MDVNSEEKLQELVSKLDEECRRRDSKINSGKTEAIGVTKANGILPVIIRTAGEAIKKYDFQIPR